MAAGKRDITIIKGDDYTNEINFVTRSAGVTSPLPITGNVYTAQLRKVVTQAAPDATFVCTVTDGPNGILVVAMGHATTAALTVGCYHWDLQCNSSGTITTVLTGKATVTSDVTR
jgi:hypothetical protein